MNFETNNKRELLSRKIFDIVYYSKDDLLEYYYSLYQRKLPGAKVIKKNDHLVIMLSGEIFEVRPHGFKYSVV
jgi:hypothetical protein